MKLPYWLQPGSQQFIDYLAMVDSMDYPNCVYGNSHAVYPHRSMAHYNALRHFCADAPALPMSERCIVSRLEVMQLHEKAMERKRIDANLF